MQFLVHEFSLRKIDVRVQQIATAQEGHDYLKSIDALQPTTKRHVILDMSSGKAQTLMTLNLEDKGMKHVRGAPMHLLRLKFQVQHPAPAGHRMLRWTDDTSTSTSRNVA